MKLFVVKIGQKSRRGEFINPIIRYLKCEDNVNYNDVFYKISSSYKGFSVEVQEADNLEIFEKETKEKPVEEFKKEITRTDYYSVVVHNSYYTKEMHDALERMNDLKISMAKAEKELKKAIESYLLENYGKICNGIKEYKLDSYDMNIQFLLNGSIISEKGVKINKESDQSDYCF